MCAAGDGRLAMALMHHGVGPILDGLAGKATLPALVSHLYDVLAHRDMAVRICQSRIQPHAVGQ